MDVGDPEQSPEMANIQRIVETRTQLHSLQQDGSHAPQRPSHLSKSTSPRKLQARRPIQMPKSKKVIIVEEEEDEEDVQEQLMDGWRGVQQDELDKLAEVLAQHSNDANIASMLKRIESMAQIDLTSLDSPKKSSTGAKGKRTEHAAPKLSKHARRGPIKDTVVVDVPTTMADGRGGGSGLSMEQILRFCNLQR